MQIERGASNTFALLGRPILSPSYWLLWFRDPERNASVYCIATASNTTGGMLTLTFTETDTPTALDGEVKLSPRGNWELKVYEQTSDTNLDPASAGRLVKTIGVLVVGDAAADTGWSGAACPPGGDCDPTTVNGTESDTPTILVQQGGVEVGTLAPSTGIHTVPECPDCDPLGYDLHNTRDTIIISGVVLDPCGATLELTAPDAELTFDGQPLLSIPSDDTANITCSTLLDAAYVEDGASITGSYVITGTLNGRSIYTLDVSHSLRYSGTRWELVKPGVDYQAAVGTQTYPWQADWSATPAKVTQGTVGTVCQGPLIPCDPLTYEVYNTEATLLIDGSQVDPCGVLVQLTVQDGSVRLRDTAANLLSTTAVPATKTVDITAPDGSVQLRDSAGNLIGSPVAVRSNQTGLGVTAPDATFRTTDGLTTITTARSNAAANAPQSRIKYKDAANASQRLAASNTELSGGLIEPATEIPRREMLVTGGRGTGKYASVGDLVANTLPTIPQLVYATWAAGDGDTLGVVFPAAMQGVAFSFVSETASNGTITVSVNNGSSFAAAPFTAGAAKVIFRRTTTTNESTATYTTA